MTKRLTRSTLISANGHCERCSAQWSAKNALALAAQHNDKTGHPTVVEQRTRTEYGGGASARAKQESLL